MEKKIVAIVGSNNENSSTEYLVDKILKKFLAKKTKYKIEIILLHNYSINYCLGCKRCFKEGICHLDALDNIKQIKNKMIDSDIILFASPVYFLNITGIFKSFFDRISHDIHLLRYAGRYGFTITTTDESGGQQVSNYLKLSQKALGITNLGNFTYVKTKKSLEDFCENTFEEMEFILDRQFVFTTFYQEKLLLMWKKNFKLSKDNSVENKYWEQSWIIKSKTFQDYASKRRIIDGKSPFILNDFDISGLFYENDNNNILKQNIMKFLKKTFLLFINEKLEVQMYPHFLLLLCECNQIVKNKEFWKYIGYKLCGEIKEEIEINGLENKLGIWSGVGLQAFAVNEFSLTFGELNKFNSDFKKLIISEINKKCNKYICERVFSVRNYDVCFGISGLLYFLLDAYNYDQLKTPIQYLILLTQFNDRKLPNYIIDANGQLNEKDKEKFSYGSINFGMAHGLIGVLIVLCKAYNFGIRIEGLKDAINSLFFLYDQFCLIDKGIPRWPVQLDVNEFKIGHINIEKVEMRSSWCYGNIAIVRGLEKAAKLFGAQYKEREYNYMLRNIIKQPIEEWQLDLPILCHGYASILIVMISKYKETKDDFYIDRLDYLINTILELSLEKGEINEVIFDENQTILQGIIGVALALNSSMSEDSHYDKLFLMD